MHMKKAWHFFAFIGCSEVLDNLTPPNYNEQSPRHLAGAPSLYSWWCNESVQVSEQPDKLLRFFLFYDVHNGIMRFFSLAKYFVNIRLFSVANIQ